MTGALRKKRNQLHRVQGVRRDVQYGDGVSERDKTDFAAALAGSRPGCVNLDKWLDSEYDNLTDTDPNAVVTLDWAPFEADRGERAAPYPVVYPCRDVWWRSFAPRTQTINQLVCAITVAYLNKDLNEETCVDLIGYEPGGSVRYFAVQEGRTDLPQGDSITQWAGPDTDDTYLIERYDGVKGLLPAILIGSEFEAGSGSAAAPVAVAPLFAAAWEGLLELLSVKSQADLIRYLHAFPRRFEYGEVCPGELLHDNGRAYRAVCSDGISPQTGQVCKQCGGTGMVGHETEQDTVRFKLNPQGTVDADLITLSKLTYSERPDLETLKAYADKVEAARASVFRTVFSSEAQPKALATGAGVETATFSLIRRDEQNNTLLPIADNRAEKYITLAQFEAKIMQIGGEVIVIYEYPRDLKLATLAELYDELKAARDAGVPDFELEQICDDLARKRYEADPAALKRYFVQKQHVPYITLTLDRFQYFDSTNRIPADMALLVANADTVFSDIEQANPQFYNLPYAERQTLVDAQVQLLQAKLKPAVTVPATIPGN